ncbi:hypothetical protein HPB50_008530 [Hyalomma asiaticum]|uniref:Uncharacterized protein n=1 Tax=Hyalomma asiaticum TaxID=266040 RepID=A0ACB7RJR6_HYAAI|nr:hypothetical protein HPB50_008530 [Hyalomma asiaticum]
MRTCEVAVLLSSLSFVRDSARLTKMGASKASSRHLYFSIAYDLALLREVNAHNTFQDPSRSGTEEEYGEKERLLQEICSLAKDFGYKIKNRKAQSSAGQRRSAAAIRDTAAATLVPTPQLALVLLKHGLLYHITRATEASCDDEPESAAELLERVARGTDVDNTPCNYKETTPVANTQPQEASTNADRPNTGEASQVMPRRRRSQAATTSADHEFIEKRWRHERALKEKEHEVEMEHLAVEKLRMEHKQQRWEKRHHLKREKTETELQQREREMEIRERQLQAQLDEASLREQLLNSQKST